MKPVKTGYTGLWEQEKKKGNRRSAAEEKLVLPGLQARTGKKYKRNAHVHKFHWLLKSNVKDKTI